MASCTEVKFGLKRKPGDRELTIHPLFRPTAFTAAMISEIREVLIKKENVILMRHLIHNDTNRHYCLTTAFMKYLSPGNTLFLRQYEGGRTLHIPNDWTDSISNRLPLVLSKPDWRQHQQPLYTLITEDSENRLRNLPEEVLFRILDFVTQNTIMKIRVYGFMVKS